MDPELKKKMEERRNSCSDLGATGSLFVNSVDVMQDKYISFINAPQKKRSREDIYFDSTDNNNSLENDNDIMFSKIEKMFENKLTGINNKLDSLRNEWRNDLNKLLSPIEAKQSVIIDRLNNFESVLRNNDERVSQNESNIIVVNKEVKILKDHLDSTNKEISDLKTANLELGRCISRLDAKERASNLIIYGIGQTNNIPIILSNLWSVLGYTDINYKYSVIGKKKDLILINLLKESSELRDEIVKNASRLKMMPEDPNQIYLDSVAELKNLGVVPENVFIKKDLHPKVRAEWRRLHDVVSSESGKAVNAGITISLDPKTRKVYRGSYVPGNVIDSWSINF